MRVLAVSDLHGDLASVHEAIDRYGPDLLVCCGDWGDAAEVAEADLQAVAARVPVWTTYGNHDPLPWLGRVRNPDGTLVLMDQGEVRVAPPLRIAAIGGIWAKSHRKAHYVTDADVAQAAARIAGGPPVDVLLTHGCPAGHADLTESGRHGGQRCFLDAFQAVAPRVHLCGHLHVAQQRVVRDGRQVINVGRTPAGDVVVIDAGPDALEVRRERFPRTGAGP